MEPPPKNPNRMLAGFERVKADIHRPAEFTKLFYQVKKLGQGGDGTVFSYRHISTNIDIAVKIPVSGASDKYVMKEIKAHTSLEGKHEHIVKLLAAITSHIVFSGPVMVLELCQLGDLSQYRERWCEQEQARGGLRRVSEVTIWKLLKDMSLALDYLHNGFATSYVHNDIKPYNIFVSYPDGWTHADGIPAEPIFKLGDFSRLAYYPTVGTPAKWEGTPEFAPPFQEQMTPIKPSVDIWCLGATMQAFALGEIPVQSREAFIRMRKAEGKDFPYVDHPKDWNLQCWRRRRLVVYRPINVSAEVLVSKFDMEHVSWNYQPYSDQLNLRYTALMQSNEVARLTAKDLVTHVVPLIDGEIKNFKSGALADEALSRASFLRLLTANTQANNIIGASER